MKKVITGTLLNCTLAISGGIIAPVEPVVEVPETPSVWEHSVSIYGWIPDFDGNINFDIEDGDEDGDRVEIDWLDKLDMFFMMNYEARKEKWSIFADMIYVDMSDSYETTVIGDNVPVSAEIELTAWVLSLYGGYCAVNSDHLTLDLITGLRYLSINTEIEGAVGRLPFNASPSLELYDAVVGFRGEGNLNKQWYIPYHFDIGGGDSDLTWRANAGMGYRFDWGDILLTYSYMYYDKGDSGLVKDLDIYGPQLGVVFHF